MRDYFSLIFWSLLALVGLVLYTNPSFWVRRMYEGFATATGTAETATAPPPAPAPAPIAPAPAPAPIQTNVMLRNLEQLLGTPGNIPDVNPTMPSAPVEVQHVSNTGRQQPEESDGKSSRPQPLDAPKVASSALEQGKVFQQTLPKAEVAVKEIIKERIVEVPVPRTCPQQQTRCPQCPDMQQYIRKDSIPCWACKL